jgi:hypothetical protein
MWKDQRNALAFVWIGAFAVLICLAFSLLLRRWIEWDTFLALVQSVSKIYGPYLGAILGFYFGFKKRSPATVPSGPAFAIALGASVLWNLANAVLVAAIHFELITAHDAIKLLGELPATLSVLVAIPVAYCFSRAIKEEKHE